METLDNILLLILKISGTCFTIAVIIFAIYALVKSLKGKL